jgi:hypothetical protein
LPRRTPVASYQPKYSCGIFTPDLVFENVRQRVGCGSLLTLNLREMSIAVDERSLLTATAKREDSLILNWIRGKQNPTHPLGGSF